MPAYPSLYQVNTRVWLTELSSTLGLCATLDDIPEKDLDQLAAKGFDWIWLLSVWQTGEAAKYISRTNAEWLSLILFVACILMVIVGKRAPNIFYRVRISNGRN